MLYDLRVSGETTSLMSGYRGDDLLRISDPIEKARETDADGVRLPLINYFERTKVPRFWALISCSKEVLRVP